jgi:hypothetical protein
LLPRLKRESPNETLWNIGPGLLDVGVQLRQDAKLLFSY